MKTVYFHIDEIARDAVVAANLKQILARRGIAMEYGNRARSAILAQCCPFDAVILPSLIIVEATVRDPANPPAPIIVLPTEGIGGIPENPQRAALKFIGARFMAGDSRWAEMVAAYCLWGHQQLSGFEKFAPHLLPHCRIIGHPRYDYRALINNKPCRQPTDKVRIGLVSRYSPINPFDRRSNLTLVRGQRKSCYHHLQQEGSILDIEDIYFTMVSDLRVMLDLIDLMDPARHEVILRPHPREDRTCWEDLIAEAKLPVTMSPWDEPFLHWVGDMDYLVAPPSTSFYDAFVARKPAFCLDRIQPRRREHVLRYSDDNSHILEYVEHPDSLDALMRLLEHKPESGLIDVPEGALALMKHDADWPQSLHALDALADVIEQAMENKPRPAPSRAARLEYAIRAGLQDYRSVRQLGIDQGCVFKLDSARQRWIDQLAAPVSATPEAVLGGAIAGTV